MCVVQFAMMSEPENTHKMWFKKLDEVEGLVGKNRLYLVWPKVDGSPQTTLTTTVPETEMSTYLVLYCCTH